jgi:hypothetical protein
MLLGVAGVVLAIAMSAPPALAKINFEWKVGGKLLAAGESREFTSSADGKDIILKFTVGASATELLSTQLEVEKGANIKGGKPGTDEEVVIFKGVKVTKPLFEGKETCAAKSAGQPAGTIKTALLKTEIVESQENGEPLILFTPKTGTAFTEIEFTETAVECVIKGAKPAVTGSVLALPLPQLGEFLTGDFDFEAKTKEFLLNPGGGTVEKAGLTVGGKPATFTGLVLRLLVSHELFGAF